MFLVTRLSFDINICQGFFKTLTKRFLQTNSWSIKDIEKCVFFPQLKSEWFFSEQKAKSLGISTLSLITISFAFKLLVLPMYLIGDRPIYFERNA